LIRRKNCKGRKEERGGEGCLSYAWRVVLTRIEQDTSVDNRYICGEI